MNNCMSSSKYLSRKNERINKHSKETYAYSTQLYWLDNSNSNKTLAPEQETVSKFQVSKCQNEDKSNNSTIYAEYFFSGLMWLCNLLVFLSKDR